jgi:hypothetical protein
VNPYGPVNNRPLAAPGCRVTCYYYASHRGLPVTYSYLQELGLRAARAAAWFGIAQARVWEGAGPPGTEPGFWVHTWPEVIFDTAAAGLAIPCPPARPRQDRISPRTSRGPGTLGLWHSSGSK